MASMAAARRQVVKREKNMFGSERRARSPASAASRFCNAETGSEAGEKHVRQREKGEKPSERGEQTLQHSTQAAIATLTSIPATGAAAWPAARTRGGGI